jgi:YHS domain-containing protein
LESGYCTGVAFHATLPPLFHQAPNGKAMKKKNNKENPKSSTKTMVYAYLTIAALLVAATVLVYWINYQELKPSISISQDEVLQPIDPSLVCMINDAYMEVTQIPVPVNGKTYYGCCQGCVDKLNNMESTRMAIDPCSGNPVDKSEAYIVLTNPQGAVAYFKSESNYNAFKNNLLTQ